MKQEKYQVIINHEMSYWALYDEEFDTPGEALDFAIGHSYGSKFYIIKIVDLKIEEK